MELAPRPESKKDYEAAAAQYKEAVELKGDHAKALNALGRVHSRFPELFGIHFAQTFVALDGDLGRLFDINGRALLAFGSGYRLGAVSRVRFTLRLSRLQRRTLAFVIFLADFHGLGQVAAEFRDDLVFLLVAIGIAHRRALAQLV